MKHPLPEPTEEQLLLAFRELYRPGRPASVEAMLAHPTWCIALRAVAKDLGRAPSRTSCPPPRTLPHAPPVPPVQPDPTRRWRGPTYDARRAQYVDD